ncbi:Valacyclovir hydrolase [Anthophora retusa]
MLVKLYRFSLAFLSFGLVNLRKEDFAMAQCDTPEEQKICVDGWNINYLKVGTGEHPVLLLPGALGSIWSHFRPQIEGLDKGKFTIVAWDPPGYGKSRPPNRTFPDDFFQRDATLARNLMKRLGYSKFSLLGWSDGGITSLILAAMFPENVRKMISVAANAYVTPEEARSYRQYQNIDTWTEELRRPLVELYGEEYFRELWFNWVDAILRISGKQDGDICKTYLPNIRCPTLIVHGRNDTGVVIEHPIYLKEHIAGAKLKIFEKGEHDLHLQYPEEFNTLVTKFLTE